MKLSPARRAWRLLLTGSWIRLYALLLVPLALWVVVFAPAAQAQAWPSKPIRVVVPFPAGSTTDNVGRVVAEQLRKSGQTVIVDNKIGANGVLGATDVARSPGDGYTIMVTNSSSVAINPQLYKKLGYETRDFTPVMMMVSAPFFLVVNPAHDKMAAVNNVADLVALAKARPGQLTYGSAGPGNLAHLGFETINNRAGIKTIHVPYKAATAAQLALLSREIDVLLDPPLTIPHVKSGKLRALAVTSSKRWPDLPNVPTLAEAGIANVEITFWLGVLVPSSTPAPIVQAIAQALLGVREDPKLMQQLQNQGQVDLLEPQPFAARLRGEVQAWGEVIRRENIQLD